MRDAQSILDQMISFCGSEISEPDVLDVYGLVATRSPSSPKAVATAETCADHRRPRG
jgi:DNA polymerase III subunit gamma/tau